MASHLYLIKVSAKVYGKSHQKKEIDKTPSGVFSATMSNTAKSSIFPGSFYILAEKEPDGVPAKKISPWSKAAFDEIYHPRLWVAAATELVGEPHFNPCTILYR